MIKEKKHNILFTIILICAFILNAISQYFIQNNKHIPVIVKIEDNENIVDLNDMITTNYEYGFFYDFYYSDYKSNWLLNINAIYEDTNGDYSYYSNTISSSYNNNNFDIFNDNFNSFNVSKIENLVIGLITSTYNNFDNLLQVDLRLYSSGFSYYDYTDLLIYNSNYYSLTSSNFDLQDSPRLYLTYQNLNNTSFVSYNQVFTFDNDNLIFDIPMGFISSIQFRPISYINSDFSNYYFLPSSSILTLQNEIDSLNNRLFNLQNIYNDVINQNQDYINTIQNLNLQLSELSLNNSNLNESILSLNYQIDLLNNDLILKDARINELTNLLNSSQNTEWKFTNLIWAIASTPMESFKTFYNVSFFGVNLSDLFLGIVFSGLIFFLFRRFIGSFFQL